MKSNKIVLAMAALVLSTGFAHATSLGDVTGETVGVVSDFVGPTPHTESAQLTYYVKSKYIPPAVTINAANDVAPDAAENFALGTIKIAGADGQQFCYSSRDLSPMTKAVVTGGSTSAAVTGAASAVNTCAAKGAALTIALLKDGTGTMKEGSHNNTVGFTVYAD